MKMHKTSSRLYRKLLAMTIPALMLAVFNVNAAPGNSSAFAVTAAVQGDVTVTAANHASPIAVRSGHFVYPGDKIVTGNSGRLQVLLSDGTVFTLGSNTVFGLDKFQYDPASGDGTILARLDKGTYQVVTGRINDVHPGNISIAMPTGMVNLHGTVVAGKSDGQQDTVVLLGPGAQKNSADKKGSFAFIPKGAAVQTADNEILVFKAGYAVTVDPDGNVSEPFKMSGRDFGQLVSSLVNTRGGTDENVTGTQDAKDLAGSGGTNNAAQNREQEQEQEQEVADSGDTQGDAVQNSDTVQESEQDSKDNLDALLQAQDVTQLADLQDITGLKGKFEADGVKMDNGGTFDFRFEFGSKESAKLDYIGYENIQTASVTDGELSWDTAVDGTPTFDQLKLSSDDNTLTAKDGCVDVCTGSVTVLNAGQGNIAKFFLLNLDTGDDTFNAKLVKPGGNNNFPGSDSGDQ